MNRRRRPACAAPLLLLVLAVVGERPARAQSLEGRVRTVTLDNGLRFLLVRRGTAPVFSGVLRFRVGSADDPTGETGLAHLFEHMAFKGTSVIGVRDAAQERVVLDRLDAAVRDLLAETDKGERADALRLEALRRDVKSLTDQEEALVVKDEFSDVLTTNGAAGLNASTSTDLTSYFVSLPSNRLELWCLLEAARLRDPVLREFYSERDVVLEERRSRVDNRPSGRLYDQLLLTAFQAHPYRLSASGWPADLEHLTRPAAEAFRRVYYVPNNAVGALVGDVDPQAAEPLLRRYFASIPAGPPPPSPVTVEPEQTGERRIRVEYDAEPQIMIGYHKPGLGSPDDPVYEILDDILSSGRTGRLFRDLVTGRQLAAGIYTFEAPGRRWPNLYVIGATPRAPHTAAEVEAAITSELERLAAEPVTAAELQKVRRQAAAAAVYALRSSAGLAAQLSLFEILTGDWRNLLRRNEALTQVTAEQIETVARRTFVESNRTVAMLGRPKAVPLPAGGAGPAAPGSGR